MITSAHIGIGISGLEGQQAARASDYAIGQFRFLKNLLFVHGREAYRRNSYLILYMFYKNVIYVLPIFWYGCLSVFSGTQIYNKYLYQCYNIFFTGLPIFWFATYDWEFPKETLLADPNLYKLGLANKCFNPLIFWVWYFKAIIQGGLLLFLTFYTLSEGGSGEKIIIFEGQVEHKTLDGSLIINGVFIFQTIVVLVNLKLFWDTRMQSFFSIFLQLFSIVTFYIFLAIFNDLAATDLYQIIPILMHFVNQYFLLFLFVTGYILLEHAFNQYIDYVNAQIDEVERMRDEAINGTIAEEKQYKMKKFTTYTRKSLFESYPISYRQRIRFRR